MPRPRVVVVGAGAAGLTAALSLKTQLGTAADVVCVTRSDRFVLAPALVRLPFGSQQLEDVSFRVAPVLDRRGVQVLHEAVTELDVRARLVLTDDGGGLGRTLAYDHLVVATGRRPDLAAVPGTVENAIWVTDLATAARARRRWGRLLHAPGDVVVVAHPDADCLCPAAELALLAAQRLREAGTPTGSRVRLVTGVTWRPAHDSLLPALEQAGVDVVSGEALSIGDHEVQTTAGPVASALTLVVPRLVAQPVVARARGLAGCDGLVPVRPTFQTVADDVVYAVGAASDVRMPWRSASPLPHGVPWSPAEASGRAAADHLARRIRGGTPHAAPRELLGGCCLLDGGDVGVLFVTHDGPVSRLERTERPLGEGTRHAHACTNLWRAQSGLLGRDTPERSWLR